MPNGADFLSDINAAQQQGMVMRMMASSGAAAPEQLVGMGMSRAAAVGKPMASAGMSLLGLDPLSLGWQAGSLAWRSGAGLLGAGSAAMAVAAPAMMVGAGVTYAGSQMMHGAQQQLALNQGLRNNFNFMNNQGGMGFTSNQGFQIGSSIHGMTGSIGPGGEVATFGELSRLASNMGRMGLAQNVRTVQEFKEKFKQMVDTLKTVATDMGTSLEEAQKVMVSLKNSGIFKGADVTRMTSGIRLGALAGGLATSEMSAMANIGSQISRSVGGLGKSGAFAGIKTIEQIGVAQRIGAITEEDIYNATGQTGAEGRQALAASQLQASGNFLKSARGRYFLASVSGKDGQLNPAAVSEWLSGGNMSTGRTAELAQQNLAGIGRANFIRNEGRLRGAALEQFGGSLQATAYKQWLTQRGYDPTNMGDLEMLAFQKFTGMGRDEADLAIKQVNSLPEQMRLEKDTQRSIGMADKLTRHKNTRGIEGFKRKFDAVKEEINGKFEHIGANILQQGQRNVEEFFNTLMGVYVDVSTEGLEDIARNLELGGTGSSARYKRTFGSGSLRPPGDTKELEHQKLQIAAAAGSDNSVVKDFGRMNADAVRRATLSSINGSPEEVVKSFQRLVDASGNEEMKAAFKGNLAQQVGMTQSMMEIAGVPQAGLISSQLAKQVFEYTPNSKFRSEADFKEDLGRTLIGSKKAGARYGSDAGILAGTLGGVAGIATGLATGIGAALGSLGSDFEAVVGEHKFSDVGKNGVDAMMATAGWLESTVGGLHGGNDKYIARANLFTDKGTKDLMADLQEGGETAENARAVLQGKMISMTAGLEKGKTLEGMDAETFAGMSESVIGSKYAKELAAYTPGGSTKGLEAAISEYRESTKAGTGTSDEEILKRMKAMQEGASGALATRQNADYQKDWVRITDNIKTDRAAATAVGYLDKDGNISAKALLDREKMSPQAASADALAQQLLTFDPTKEGAHEEYIKLKGQTNQAIGRLSIEEKRNIAATRGGTLEGDMAAYQAQVEDRFTKFSKGEGGELGAAARLLGIEGVDASALKALNSATGAGKKDAINSLLSKGGIKDEKLAKDLAAALSEDDLDDAGNVVLGKDGKAIKSTKGSRAAKLDAALANMSEETKKKLQESKATKDDPSYRMLDQIREQAVLHTGLLRNIANHEVAPPPAEGKK